MKINHQNVVRFLGFCSNTHHISIQEAGSSTVDFVNVRERLLCLEYVRNGSLDKHITDELRGLEWETRYDIITGICKGLCHLREEKQIVHMDLKPANILLEDHMVPKITDFGLSRPNENSYTMGQRFGTRGYFAPEYETFGKTSFECDIYSLGVIITELVTGCKGAPNKNKVLRRWRHRWNKPPALLQYRQVTRCIEIAVRCRQQESGSRPSIFEIISILGESESTDGQTGQESTYLDDDMLGIEPLKLKFYEEMSRSVKLTNRTKACFAFSIERPSKQYNIQPDRGIVTPGCSECLVQIAVTALQVTQNAGKLIVRSTKVNEGLRVEDITKDIFHEVDGKVVDEVDLMVVYEPTKPQENCKSREDTNMPAEVVPEAKKKKIVGSSYKVDIDSSTRRESPQQIEQQCKFYPPQSFSRHYPINTTYLGRGSRAVDVARGAMGSLLDKLGKLVKEDYNLERSLKRDIESFSEDLAKIHKDLPNLEKLDGVEIWVDEVRELSYSIEDILDSFVVRVETDSSGSGFRELPHEGLKFLENDMTTHRQIGDVIRDIKNKVQAVADRQKKYNFEVNNAVANATTNAPIDPRMAIINKEQLIGIEARTDQLIKLLFEKDDNVLQQELRIVSIVGLGGLGKTTLAKAVYDKIKPHYHSRAFVPVGQNPDVKKVLMNILIAVRNNFNESNLEVWQLIDELKEFLKDKRCTPPLPPPHTTPTRHPMVMVILHSN
ncbi:hypothetical protein ACQJBY_062172 [Aegilops geniculata]